MAFETRKTIFQNKLNLDMGNLYKMNGTSSNQEYANANNYEDVDYSTNNEINMNKALQDVLINTRDKLEKQRQALSKSTSTYIPLHDRTEIDNDNIDELREIEDQLTIINMYINELERQSKLNEYNDIIESVEYQSFVEHYTYDTDEIANGAARALQSEVPYDLYENYDRLAIAEYLVNQYGTVDKVINNNAFMQQEVKDMLNNYNYMSEEERNIYHYLYVTEGEESAETYQSLIQSEINQARGVDLANQFLNELDINDEGKVTSSVSNILDTSIQGLGDGITTFFAGINNALENNEILTAEEYRNLVILQTLSENSHILDGVYEFNSALGNMVPAIVTSAIVSYLGSPAAGSKVASTLIGTSAYGNAKHQALNRGNDVVSSTVYGILVGGSEATLGYFLGSIPGISETSGLTLSNLLSEGVEEFSQEWIDAGLRTVILGENVDWSSVPSESVNSFLMGVLMAGLLNGGQSAINITVNGIQQTINVQDILTDIEKHPNANINLEEAVLPFLFNSKQNDVYNRNISIDNYMSSHKNNYNNAIYQILYNCGIEHRSDTKNVAEQIYEHLINNGYDSSQAANMISSAQNKVIEKIGMTTIKDSDRKIVIRFQNNIDFDELGVNDLFARYDSLPLEIRDLIKTINFYDTFNPHDFYWQKRYNIPNFVSAATGGDGVINFWGNNYDMEILTHEIGHTYDTVKSNQWNIGLRISESSVWEQAMMRDKILSGLSGVSSYAIESNSPLEDFADSFSYFYTYPELLNKFPNRKELLVKYLPKPNSVLSTTLDISDNINNEISLETLKTDFNNVFKIMERKYGHDVALRQIQEYLNTGNITFITRESNARNLIKKYSILAVRNYVQTIDLNNI